jgi:hypothetical protein
MWNYRIIKKRDKELKEDHYFLAEVYYENNGSPMAYTDNDFICGNTKDEIIDVLEMMIKDAKKHPVLSEKEFKVKNDNT